SVEITDGERTLDVSGADTGPTEKNLAWRAAAAYSQLVGWPRGWRVSLEKRIPPGGGLGGGSADAGAVLRILNRLNDTPLPERALLNIGGSLGADVPFLATESPLALAWGRGERILPLEPLEERPIMLWMYPFGVSTAEAFGWLASDRHTEGGDCDALQRSGAGQRSTAWGGTRAQAFSPDSFRDWSSITAIPVNDLEPTVLARHPELAEGLAALSSTGAPVLARMTGTGSTLFAIPLEQPATGVRDWAPAAPPAAAGQPRELVTTTAVRVEEVEIIE